MLPGRLLETLPVSLTEAATPENTLLLRAAGSQFPSYAQALISFPLGCLIAVSWMNCPFAVNPVSSSNSRCAAVRASSLSTYSPFGSDHAPWSFLAQNGPPG